MACLKLVGKQFIADCEPYFICYRQATKLKLITLENLSFMISRRSADITWLYFLLKNGRVCENDCVNFRK